jgi:hypothetical protein
MAAKIPYLAAPGSIATALTKIKAASTPDKVTLDFIKTKLDIKGSTGNFLLPYLKKIGFVNSNGSPSDLYKSFRNPSESGIALAKAIKIGYKSLYEVNEYAHDLTDKELKGTIIQITGCEDSSKVLTYTLNTFKNIKKDANFEVSQSKTEPDKTESPEPPKPIQEFRNPLPHGGQTVTKKIGMNLAYTINLNLPATSDPAVFNAIFKSLKENLLINETD